MAKKIYRGYFRGGDREDPADDRDYGYATNPVAKVKLASASGRLPRVDWSPKMSPVKWQGYLGSCVGFAACAMKECQELIEHEREVADGKKYKRDEKEYNLSEQWVYWNCKKIDPWPGEEGTNIRSAMKVLNKIGVPTEDAWPYTDDPVNIGEPKGWAHLVARWYTIGSYWRVRDLNELRLALQDGPVVIGIPCFDEIFDPGPSGFIPLPADTSSNSGWHAVCAVGMNDRYKLIKFKNSWSIFWGERGYGYLPYAYINNFLGDSWAARDISVTTEMLRGSRSLVD